MVKRILAISDGIFIGLVAGTILGTGLGWMADLVFEPKIGYWLLWGGILGVLAGFVSGLGICIIGLGTRYSIEWVIINSFSVPFGFFLMDMGREWGWFNWKFILTISVFGAIAGWLTVLLIGRILGDRIPRRTFSYRVVMAYLVIFAILTYTSPRWLQFVAMAISP